MSACDCTGGRRLLDWYSLSDLYDIPRGAYEDEWGVWWVPCGDCTSVDEDMAVCVLGGML